MLRTALRSFGGIAAKRIGTSNQHEPVEYDRLAADVDEVLAQLAATTTFQLEVFREKNPSDFTRLDKELELLMGEKERRIGAMRQHAGEHKCQQPV